MIVWPFVLRIGPAQWTQSLGLLGQRHRSDGQGLVALAPRRASAWARPLLTRPNHDRMCLSSSHCGHVANIRHAQRGIDLFATPRGLLGIFESVSERVGGCHASIGGELKTAISVSRLASAAPRQARGGSAKSRDYDRIAHPERMVCAHAEQQRETCAATEY
jgi:hypothetical protein